jgi:hypothetical protein
VSGDSDDDDHEEPVYKTYVHPLRAPLARVEPAPQPPEPVSEPVATTTPPPAPQAAPPEPQSAPPPPPASPPAVVPPVPHRSEFKNFEFRKAGLPSGRRRLGARVGAAIVVAVGLALAYPIVNPFGSSSGASLTRYLGRVQPIVSRAAQDRRSVQSAVNAVRSNPKGRTGAARQLGAANRDRQALIQKVASLGSAPGAASALPARLTRLLQIQIQTGRVWQRWMLQHPFKYLKHDAATRGRIQSLLASQQASKGAFTRLYAQLIRDAGLPLTSLARI